MAKIRKGPKEWSPRGKTPGEPLWPEFVDSYLEAALWTSIEEGTGRPFDQLYSIEDFAQEAVDQAVQESNDFIRFNRKDLESVGDPSRHGRNFWLTRNGHGSGFWDEDYGEVGERLSAKAHAYGETDVYKGDDGKLYFGPG